MVRLESNRLATLQFVYSLGFAAQRAVRIWLQALNASLASRTIRRTRSSEQCFNLARKFMGTHLRPIVGMCITECLFADWCPARAWRLRNAVDFV